MDAKDIAKEYVEECLTKNYPDGIDGSKHIYNVENEELFENLIIRYNGLLEEYNILREENERLKKELELKAGNYDLAGDYHIWS